LLIEKRLAAENFLSRLCGGESIMSVGSKGVSFLSRLCGGELRLYQHIQAFLFLSRLCGGE